MYACDHCSINRGRWKSYFAQKSNYAALILFQTHKTFIHLWNTNEDICWLNLRDLCPSTESLNNQNFDLTFNFENFEEKSS